MTGCDDLRTSLGAYVLGALDVDEAADVRRHLQDCEGCAAERDALTPLPGLLSLAGGADAAVSEPLSAAFEERLLDAYAREHSGAAPHRGIRRLRRRLRPSWLAVGAATAVAAAAVALGFFVFGGGDERRYGVEFRNVSNTQASAKANLQSSDGGTTVHLWVKGLPHDDHAVYEVLCDAQMWTASAGTFRTDADGHAYVVLTTALRRGEYDGIRIVKRGHRADGKLVLKDILAARLS
jgi:putative zinc finger protein